MVNFKLCIVFSLVAMIPISQAIKCIVCSSTKGSDKECDDGTKAATDCGSSGDICLSVYTTATMTMQRTCASKASVDATITAAKLLLGNAEK